MPIMKNTIPCPGRLCMASYTDDPTRVFWFIHIADLHIDNDASSHEEANLAWTLGECVDVVRPSFVTATGDLVDHSDGLCYWCGVQPDEWDLYRTIVDHAGMTQDFYFDIPGNHDVYADPGAASYLARSVQGQAQGTTQPQWRLDLPFGSYHFFSVATTCNDWAGWPADNCLVTDEEIEEIRANLEANKDARLSIALGHHDYIKYLSASNAAEVDALLAGYGVPLYLYGHEHKYGARLSDDGVVRVMASALGKSDVEHVCLWAVDADTFSHACVSALDPWPLAVITAPVDAMLGPDDDVPDPYAPPVPLTMARAPLRILAYDTQPITAVTYSWDTGSGGSFEESTDIHGQWLATFDATGFSEGPHKLSVEIVGTSTRTLEAQVFFGERPVIEEEPEATAEEGHEPVAEEDAGPEAADDAEAAQDIPGDGADAADGREDGGEEGDGGGGGCACRTV
jgi:hypothetical protein